jgi:hypothetical protein
MEFGDGIWYSDGETTVIFSLLCFWILLQSRDVITATSWLDIFHTKWNVKELYEVNFCSHFFTFWKSNDFDFNHVLEQLT